MKKILLILLPFIFLTLCSFVDPDTIDVYTGTIQHNDNDYNSTRLSGTITYYLDNYDDICLTAGGGLFNGSNGSYNGTAIIGGTEYNIRFNARSELQIQQYYYSGNIQRSEWVDYILYPDIIPLEYELPNFSIIIIVVIVLLISTLILFKVML